MLTELHSRILPLYPHIRHVSTPQLVPTSWTWHSTRVAGSSPDRPGLHTACTVYPRAARCRAALAVTTIRDVIPDSAERAGRLIAGLTGGEKARSART
eukprot:3933897-Rhodomonas_salina.8